MSAVIVRPGGTLMADHVRAAETTAILQCFARDSWIQRRPGGWYVCWERRPRAMPGGVRESRRYTVGRGGSHHPPWSQRWGHGGTACEALYQLIRWCRGQPVVPLSAWERWASTKIRLLRPDDLDLLRRMDWPRLVHCVRCGKEIGAARDWWDLDGVSGPLCCLGGGCGDGR